MAGHDPYRPHTTRRTAVAPEPALPVARLRRLGVDAAAIIGLAQGWAGMSSQERIDASRTLAALTDDELVNRLAAPPAPIVAGGVPSGTAVAVLEWVRAQPDIPAAARTALEAERVREPKPRTTLIANLEALT